MIYVDANPKEFMEKHGITEKKPCECGKTIELHRPFFMNSGHGKMAGMKLKPHGCSHIGEGAFCVVPTTQEGIDFWSVAVGAARGLD